MAAPGEVEAATPWKMDSILACWLALKSVFTKPVEPPVEFEIANEKVSDALAVAGGGGATTRSFRAAAAETLTRGPGREPPCSNAVAPRHAHAKQSNSNSGSGCRRHEATRHRVKVGIPCVSSSAFRLKPFTLSRPSSREHVFPAVRRQTARSLAARRAGAVGATRPAESGDFEHRRPSLQGCWCPASTLSSLPRRLRHSGLLVRRATPCE